MCYLFVDEILQNQYLAEIWHLKCYTNLKQMPNGLNPNRNFGLFGFYPLIQNLMRRRSEFGF